MTVAMLCGPLLFTIVYLQNREGAGSLVFATAVLMGLMAVTGFGFGRAQRIELVPAAAGSPALVRGRMLAGAKPVRADEVASVVVDSAGPWNHLVLRLHDGREQVLRLQGSRAETEARRKTVEDFVRQQAPGAPAGAEPGRPVPVDLTALGAARGRAPVAVVGLVPAALACALWPGRPSLQAWEWLVLAGCALVGLVVGWWMHPGWTRLEGDAIIVHRRGRTVTVPAREVARVVLVGSQSESGHLAVDRADGRRLGLDWPAQVDGRPTGLSLCNWVADHGGGRGRAPDVPVNRSRGMGLLLLVVFYAALLVPVAVTFGLERVGSMLGPMVAVLFFGVGGFLRADHVLRDYSAEVTKGAGATD